MKIAPIVEGEGEVASVPILLRRLARWRAAEPSVEVMPPIRVRRDRFIRRDDEFRRHLLLAASKCGADGWVLVLLDADDDCPAVLGPDLLQRARTVVATQPLSVVLANREYEAWFIAAARSLEGCRGLSFGSAPTIDAETPRNAKDWLRQHMAGRHYGSTTDQPALTARMDLEQAFAGSRSFRKLCSEWDRAHSD